MNEFYVGYQPKAPERLGRSMFRTILALNGVAIVVLVLLVFGQQPFADSKFEYRQYRDYAGAIVESPYPSLQTREGGLLLVAPGKHGAADLVKGLNLRGVQLRGSLIRRGDDRMLEVIPGSIHADGRPAEAGPNVDLGAVTLTGEIVDSKCYFGVMNPGNGKVHRDCAVRCISGGIPPAFIAKDASGQLRTLILAGASGRKVNREVLGFVAEPIRISGRLVRSGETLILEAEPNSFRHFGVSQE